ncbi:hypothetical protein [Anabaena azotica]|uniref:hypothetical protein n=1 Tax=Anabaena azotica TaxID=197653 RepID=UPI0039A6D17D
MSSNTNNSVNVNILSSFASLLAVLSIFVYFSGWIYRWAYYGFFELEITSIQLPFESFFIVPVQIFLGDTLKLLQTSLLIICLYVVINFTLWLIKETNSNDHKNTHTLILLPAKVYLINNESKHKSTLPQTSNIKSQKISYKWKHFSQQLHEFYLLRKLRSFTKTLSQPLSKDIVIVSWVLTALFCFSYYQGHADAVRDAVNQTSTRPIVTLVTKKENLAIGRNLVDPQVTKELDKLLSKPSSPNDFRIVGDVNQFYLIWRSPTNDMITNPEEPTVWRLLIQTDKWVYLFPALSSKRKSYNRPPLLIINTDQSQIQLLILSRPADMVNK